MIRRLLYAFTARRPARLIYVNDRPYLERYYLGQLFGATFYLHRFVSPDRERHLHNHPWTWGRALVLAGGYDEERVVDLWDGGALTKTERVSWWNVVDANVFHRIENADPETWTLFAHGPRQRVGILLKGWGFLDGRDFVPAPVSGPRIWWRTARTGQDVGRVPFSAR